MHTLIFANGAPTASPPATLPTHDLRIAADGGARLAQSLGVTPNVIIGDMDSLTPEELAAFTHAGALILRHPAAKDQTDLELVLDYAIRKGATEITLYGLLGGRWDMTFANVLLLAAPRYADVRLRVVEGGTTMHILRGGNTLPISGRAGDRVSVIPLGGAAVGVTYHGLAWSLQNTTLPHGTPRGVSNTLAASAAKISLDKGTLLIIVSKIPT